MLMEILDVTIDHHRLRDEIIHNNAVGQFLEDHSQISVQCRPNITGELQLLEGIGSLTKDWDSYDPRIHKVVPDRTDPLHQDMFTEIADLFKGTYLEEVVRVVNLITPVVRARLMRSRMKSCLSMHKDPTKRIHIPIDTNDNCFMVVEDSVLRLPFGKTYMVDTTLSHTAVNASNKTRTHLVFCCR